MTTCSDCGQDHEHQRVDYPVGATVVSLWSIADGGSNVHPGDTGKVMDHCQDGRAVIEFKPGGPTHTFHYPVDFISVVAPLDSGHTNEVDQLRADLARVTAERDELRAALEPFAKVADIINYPVHDPGSMYIWSRNSNKPGETYGVTLADCQRARAALDSTKEQ